MGTPAGWGQWNGGAPWNNAGYGYGGTNINYDNNWIGSGIANGSALNGFIVHTTSVAAPTSVNWYAFEGGSTPYYGNDAHYTGTPTSIQSCCMHLVHFKW